MTCGACPEQYEGLLEDGRALYIRFRHSRGAVSVGSTLDDAVTADWPGFKSDGRALLRFVDDEHVDAGMLPDGALGELLYQAGLDLGDDPEAFRRYGIDEWVSGAG